MLCRDKLNLFKGEMYQVTEDSGERCVSKPFLCAAKRLVRILRAEERLHFVAFLFSFL